MSRLTKLDKMTQEQKTALVDNYRKAPEDALFPPETIALVYYVSLSLLQKMRCEGNGPIFTKITSKTVLYKKSDVLEWIKSREIKHTS